MAISAPFLVQSLSQLLAGNMRGKIAGTERAREVSMQDADRARAMQVQDEDRALKARLQALQERLLGAHADYYDRSPGAGRTRTQAQTQNNHNVTAVHQQIQDTNRDLSAARRAMPKRPALGFETPADSTAFSRDSSAQAQRVTDLQNRSDSLRYVGDSVVAVAGGRKAPVRANPAQQAARQAKLARLQEQYANAIARGADPAKAKAILDRESQAITAGP